MVARDRYQINLKYENCTETGVISISENDYPFMKKVGRSVDYANGNFTAQMMVELEVLAICKKCGHGTIGFK
jgi:hypothetical protein